MRYHRVAIVLAVLLIGLMVAPVDSQAERPRQVPPFKLSDPRDARVVDTAAWKDARAIVVVFLGTECPVNNEYLPELNRLHGDYASKGVRFVGVNANRQDTPTRVAAHARKHAIAFPVVKDPGNKVADAFAALRTPEVFLLSGSGKVLYHGRIDDQFGVLHRRPGRPTRRDLVCALDEVLAGKAVTTPRTEVAGCFIGRVKEPKADATVTYARDVSRIFQKHCQECHRPGQIGPFSLLDYDDAAAWADTIREVVDEGRMPPWYADPKIGKWHNDRRLSEEEKKTIRTWVAAGAPRGDHRDLPPARTFPADWQIGKPDVVLHMTTPYKVPAVTPKGGVPYQYFSVTTPFKEDRWVERAEARPGAPEVVHHIILFIVPPGERLNPGAPGSVLAGMAPGEMPLILEPGYAKKIPAGARLVFQVHYTPNGKAQEDRSSLGLIFAKKPPRHRVYTRPITNRLFVTRLLSIPPEADNHEMEAVHTFPQDIRLLSLMPHMHLRGKDFLYEAIYPDGKKEAILSVPRYNFNWQSVYRPIKPIALPKGTKIRCVAHFDNSSKNANNPDPKQRIFWGDQTWEEMMIGWVDYVVDGEKP